VIEATAGTAVVAGVAAMVLIAMSRFGYLRTPMPAGGADASAAAQADSAPPMPAWIEGLMMRVLGSDFLFWIAIHVTREQVIRLVLATPPELVAAASPQERARVDAMIDNILPVSTRAAGLRSDTAAGKHLAPAALETIRVPTLIVSARDDGYGTYASAAYTASRIAGATFIGFDQGGHAWVGHDDEVMSEIVKVLRVRGRNPERLEETPVK
jgi:pimeloyl-ACP methyl ester carboxylesterase